MNENEQKKSVQETKGTRKSQETAPSEASSFSWKRLLGKKWVFPAVYMMAAALILTLVWVYQDGTVSEAVEEPVVYLPAATDSIAPHQDETALPVVTRSETMQWPVQDRNELEVIMPFYEESASAEVKQAALIEYGDTFTPHLGIDLASQDNKEFDVLAALSGTVTLVERHPLVGYQVEISHSNDLVTVYQSLSNVVVQLGAEVSQGQLIAQAGRNELEKDHGVHLHFEVREGSGGGIVNPEKYLSLGSDTASSSISSDTEDNNSLYEVGQ